MKRVGVAAGLALAFTGGPVGSAAAARQAAPAEYRAMLDAYCVTCHNQRTDAPAGTPLRLDEADLEDLAADAETWEKVVRKLGVGAMPPEGSPTPGAAALDSFRSALIASLDAAASSAPRPGRYVVHRLNRNEYANAVRDLLGVELDVAEYLPSDGGDFGFDNVAAALKSSPMLVEGYLAAALAVSDLAVGDADAEPGAATYSIGAEVSQREHVDGLPIGTRGGILARHNFPADAEYVFNGRLLRTVAEGYVGVEGHETPYAFVVTIDGAEVYAAYVGGPDDHDSSTRNIAAAQAEIDARMTSPPIWVPAGPRDVGFTFIDRPDLEQSVWQPALRDTQEAHNASGLPRLRSGSIEGPYNATGAGDAPSRRRVFVCEPSTPREEAPCADRILSTVARRAFRRPVAGRDIEAPLAFYQQARESGGDFDAGVRAGLVRILASPKFVFRAEEDPPGLPRDAAHRITDLELASRLSFFLWSSIPDDELLDLAEAGRLSAPGILEAQVRRMIADRRADAMIAEFVGQWLQLRNLDKVTPDLLMFPDFDDNVRQAFRTETELMFSSVLRENRSVLDLMDADYTFLNERLARHYGIPGVYGSRFRRVSIADPNRRGLLGHGSFLALTAAADRTSPIMRGEYVLSNFLNTPPPPPPPAVFEFEDDAPSEGSVREQLERHSANPGCAACHRYMDPVGFALENFNAVGQWQDAARDGRPIDSAGLLAGGARVEGPVALRNALLTRPEVFAGAVTEKLMTYALGRGLEAADMPLVRGILNDAAPDDYALRSIVLGIVRSPAFQMRTKLFDSATVDPLGRGED